MAKEGRVDQARPFASGRTCREGSWEQRLREISLFIFNLQFTSKPKVIATFGQAAISILDTPFFFFLQ